MLDASRQTEPRVGACVTVSPRPHEGVVVPRGPRIRFSSARAMRGHTSCVMSTGLVAGGAVINIRFSHCHPPAPLCLAWPTPAGHGGGPGGGAETRERQDVAQGAGAPTSHPAGPFSERTGASRSLRCFHTGWTRLPPTPRRTLLRPTNAGTHGSEARFSACNLVVTEYRYTKRGWLRVECNSTSRARCWLPSPQPAAPRAKSSWTSTLMTGSPLTRGRR